MSSNENSIPTNAPRPRSCHIVKWPDFDGYGFNLHANKSHAGQYIGKVDTDSPASVSGLMEGDRIIEVNGVNISNENHKQVVQRIKNVANETRLLVLDSETDKWYKEQNIVVYGDQSNIIFGTSVRNEHNSMTNGDSNRDNSTTNGDSNRDNSTTNGDSIKLEDDAHSVASAQSSSQSESSTQPQPSSSTPSVQNGSETTLEQDSPSPVPVEPIPPNYDNIVLEDDKKQDDIIVIDDDVIIIADDKEVDLPGDLQPRDDDHYEDIAKINEDSDIKITTNGACELNSNEESAPQPEENEDRHSIKSSSSSLSSDREEAAVKEESSAVQSPMSTTPTPPPSIEPETNGSVKNVSSFKNGGLNLNMTAAEMRAHLALKKKFDPRKDTLDLKSKYKIIQNM